MDFLQNPNITYLMLAGGLIFAVLALVSPADGDVLEIGALFVLGLAGWGIATYNIPSTIGRCSSCWSAWCCFFWPFAAPSKCICWSSRSWL